MPDIAPAIAPVFLTAALLISLLLWPGSASADSVYRCATEDGVKYADSPCGDNAQVIEIDDTRLGGSLAGDGSTVLSPERDSSNEEPQTEESADTQQPSPCRVFQSTDLRTYLIREQVVQGMTRSHVREAWGAPVEAYAGPVEMWTYDNSYYGRLMTVTRVYFEDGCVTTVDTVKP